MLPKPKSIFENWHPFVRTGAATTRSKLEEKQRNFIAKWGPLVRNKMEIPIMLHVDLVHWRTTAANQRRAYDRGEESGRKFVSSMLGWETIIDDPRTAEIARELGYAQEHAHMLAEMRAIRAGWNNPQQFTQARQDREVRDLLGSHLEDLLPAA